MATVQQYTIAFKSDGHRAIKSDKKINALEVS